MFVLVIPIVMITNDCLGRRPTMGILAGLAGILFMLLHICMPKGVAIGLLFAIRALTSGMMSIVYLYTTEVSVLDFAFTFVYI